MFAVKILLDGEVFGFSGKIKGYTKDGLAEHMRAHGATVLESSPNKNMSCFLVGERAASRKIDAARALGLTIIEGGDLYTLLERLTKSFCVTTTIIHTHSSNTHSKSNEQS